MLVTPETNTAASGRVGNLSGPDRELIVGSEGRDRLERPVRVVGGEKKGI
jgi:hypothetical protein